MHKLPSKLHTIVRALAGLEWLVVILAVPLLTFPTLRPRWTAGALALLAGLWLLRWAVRREPWPVTPLNAPLLAFMAAIPLAVHASAFPALTVPAAVRLVLGLAAFRAVAFAVGGEGSLDLAIAAFCALGLGIAVVGALGVRWPQRVGVFAAATQRIPRLIETIPEDQGMPGVNPNHLAGGIVLYLPLALALVWRAWLRRRALFPLVAVLAIPAAVGFLLAIGAVLLLAQSRSGWIGGVGGIVALLVLAGVTHRSPWVRAAGAALALAVVGTLVGSTALVGPRRIGAMVMDVGDPFAVEGAVGPISLVRRVELWERALLLMRDFPLTGCGLGTFSRVVQIRYPLVLHGPGADVGHAHNTFLQMGVDVGLPGLLAYLALVLAALAVCWVAARQRAVRPVALGLAAGLVGWHLYGVTDAVALGTKPAVVLWVALGLTAALGREGGPWRPRDLGAAPEYGATKPDEHRHRVLLRPTSRPADRQRPDEEPERDEGESKSEGRRG